MPVLAFAQANFAYRRLSHVAFSRTGVDGLYVARVAKCGSFSGARGSAAAFAQDGRRGGVQEWPGVRCAAGHRRTSFGCGTHNADTERDAWNDVACPGRSEKPVG